MCKWETKAFIYNSNKPIDSHKNQAKFPWEDQKYKDTQLIFMKAT